MLASRNVPGALVVSLKHNAGGTVVAVTVVVVENVVVVSVVVVVELTVVVVMVVVELMPQELQVTGHARPSAGISSQYCETPRQFSGSGTPLQIDEHSSSVLSNARSG